MNYADLIAIQNIKDIEEPKNLPITAGQPKKFKFKDIQKKIIKYFEHCSQDLEFNEKPTITGLAMVCGFYGRSQFYEYMEYPEFSDLLKVARTFVESSYERSLNKNNGAAGPIFALKQFGWKDTIEQTNTDGNVDPETLKKEIASLIKSEQIM